MERSTENLCDGSDIVSTADSEKTSCICLSILEYSRKKEIWAFKSRLLSRRDNVEQRSTLVSESRHRKCSFG